MTNDLKLNLPNVDDLFGLDNSKKIIKIPIKDLRDFPNHPFKVIKNEELTNMAQSIKENNGVIVPIIVRRMEDGTYQVISGHRRKEASKIAGLTEIRAIVEDLSDAEATIKMVDSNMQRTEILPSERAYAYKMKLEAEKSQGKRTDLDFTTNGREV